MQYECLRECWLDRLYAEGERVGPEAAARWPEHFAPVRTHANDTEAENMGTKETGREPATGPVFGLPKPGPEPESESEPEPPQAPPPTLADGTPLAGLRRWELRRLARQRHPGKDIAWGRTRDMAAALARLERTKAREGRSTATNTPEETQ